MSRVIRFIRRVFDGKGGESAVIGIATEGREFVAFSVEGNDFAGTPEFAAELGAALVAAAAAVKDDGGGL